VAILVWEVYVFSLMEIEGEWKTIRTEEPSYLLSWIGVGGVSSSAVYGLRFTVYGLQLTVNGLRYAHHLDSWISRRVKGL
jgi:hypothetical protein